MPVHDEPAWVLRSVERLVEELSASPWAGRCEVVVVDDGSTDETPEVLAGLAREHAVVRVVRQDNAGRMAARTRGLQEVTGNWVLFLDSRVLLRPGALKLVAGRAGVGARVWNAHVHVSTDGNAYALFWDALTRLAWHAYFGDPRTTSYGIEDFDRYPKGTTAFFAPRALLLEAWAAFSTFYEDVRHANDDTSVIRHLAERERIWLSPEFACDYASRQTLGQFVRHARARGTVFVDGHLRRGSRFAPVIAAFYPVSVLALVTARRRWWLPLVPLGAGAAASGLVVGVRLDARSGRAVARLGVPFVLSFGTGMWKGALLALRARSRR